MSVLAGLAAMFCLMGVNMLLLRRVKKAQRATPTRIPTLTLTLTLTLALALAPALAVAQANEHSGDEEDEALKQRRLVPSL